MFPVEPDEFFAGDAPEVTVSSGRDAAFVYPVVERAHVHLKELGDHDQADPALRVTDWVDNARLWFASFSLSSATHGRSPTANTNPIDI